MKGTVEGLDVLLGVVLAAIILVPVIAISGGLFDHFFNRGDAVPRGTLLEIVSAVNGLSQGGSVQVPYSIARGNFYLIGKMERFDSITTLNADVPFWNAKAQGICEGQSCICIWEYDDEGPTEKGWCERVNSECITAKPIKPNMGAKAFGDSFFLFLSSNDPLWLVVEKDATCEGGNLLFSVQFK